MQEPNLVRKIHDTPHQLVLAITGGGCKAVDALLSVPGASRTVREVIVPYHERAMMAFLGHRPEHFCGEETARRMAMRAFFRSREFGTEVPLAGIGCTAGLATDRPRRGSHRVHVAVQTVDRTAVRSLVLEKNRRSRDEEEEIAARLILNAIAEAMGLSHRVPLPLFDNEQIVADTADAPEPWQELLLGKTNAIAHGTEETDRPKAILCGSFNPMHDGHRRMAQTASEILGFPVHFEMTIQNADKPPLDYLDLKHRLAGFEPEDKIWLTRADIFARKADLFPGVIFVVGADTISRIGKTRFYGGSDEKLTWAIKRFQETGCRFLVFGRQGVDGFETVRTLEIPPALCVLCHEVPESQFRLDVSSSELRQGVN
jgi:nicotinamide mononucleotide (NMN) deamidase PncC